MRDFRVGDRVTIHTSQNGPQALSTVDRFTDNGRCLVLADGSRWRADGQRQWHFRGSWYTGPTLALTVAGDAEIIGKRSTIGALRKWAQDLNMTTPLDGAALRRILDLVQAEARAAAGPAGDQPDGDAATDRSAANHSAGELVAAEPATARHQGDSDGDETVP